MDIQAVLNDLSTIGHEELFKSNAPNPDIYALYLEFVATGRFPYIRDVQEFIEEKLPRLDAVRQKNLGSHVYYASRKYREEKKQTHKEEMLAQGWRVFDPLNTISEAVSTNKKVLINHEGEGVLGEYTHNDVYRPFVDGDGRAYLMKPRARSRGFSVNQFAGSFYKFI
ncbi:MAG: hypothetical protein A2X93_04695 [Deltaproteobacteria bacterium GWC2_56_8]|nr:MAG: hypothetical protein A2X93_04695 [Deltaproteobacteria bacterium GWC2_56_8]